jgi:hypothetical protein
MPFLVAQPARDKQTLTILKRHDLSDPSLSLAPTHFSFLNTALRVTAILTRPQLLAVQSIDTFPKLLRFL